MSGKCQKRRAALVGAATGFVNGFFGGGGGMVCVPLMQSAVNLSAKQAHATAVFFILPLSVISGVCYAAFGTFPQSGWWVAAGVTLGGALGAALLSRISEKAATAVFTLIMALSGAYLLLF